MNKQSGQGGDKTNFKEFERVRIPAKGITGTTVDKHRDPNDGVIYYMVQNHEWGYVGAPDAWNIGYVFYLHR